MQNLFSDLGSSGLKSAFPRLQWCSRSGSSPGSRGWLTQGSPSGSAVCRGAGQAAPHDCRGARLPSDSGALTQQSLCKTFSGSFPFPNPERLLPVPVPSCRGDLLTPGCFRITQVVPCDPKEATGELRRGGGPDANASWSRLHSGL